MKTHSLVWRFMIKFRNRTRRLCSACDLATGFSGKKISGHLSQLSFAEESWRPCSVIYMRYRRLTLGPRPSSACCWLFAHWVTSPVCGHTLNSVWSPSLLLLPEWVHTQCLNPELISCFYLSLCTFLGCTDLGFLIWADLLWSISCPDKLRLKCKPRWIWQSWPVDILVDSALVIYECLRMTDRNNDSIYFKEEKSLGKIANDTFKYLTGPRSSSCLIWKHTESIIVL